MTTRVLPDTEALVVAYLRTLPEVDAIAGDRIGTTLDVTTNAQLPALRITRVSARLVARRQLRASNVQLEGFAETDLEAQDLTETAWAALFEPGFVGVWPSLGVVTGVDDALGPRSFPDPFTETPRWLASVIVYAHPIQ